MSEPKFLEVSFENLPGWEQDDHRAAFVAFVASAREIAAQHQARAASGAKASAGSVFYQAVQDVCRLALSRSRVSRAEARYFFEHAFAPFRVLHEGGRGLLTGFYEPIVEGARERHGRYQVPLYRRPPELETVVAETDRGRAGDALTHMRRTATGLVPFATRAEIEAGALEGRGLELMWLTDPVDAFFAQVQGSLCVRLSGGAFVTLTYDGKNGHPYRSIGRVLIDRGEISAADVTMQRLGAWLRADDARGRALMRENPSFVFFRESETASATGVIGTPLVAGRSLAIDTTFHTLGMPIFVEAPTLVHAGGRRPFHRLMVAHDVGSAIRGPERGDIYFGSGARAASLAGITKHHGHLYALLPRADRGRRR